MPSCPHCGTEAAAVTLFCGSCGANATAPDVKAHDPHAAARALSPNWIHRFTLLERAGGVRLPAIGKLPFGERVVLLFNVWAFLFGPFYYLAKGMGRKGLSLFGILLALLLVLNLTVDSLGLGESRIDSVGNLLGPLLFALRANIDYYKKIRRGDAGWW